MEPETPHPKRPESNTRERLPPPASPDLDGDGKVNIKDLALEVTAFATNSTMPGYISRYDFNQDNVINIQDLEIVVLNFGQ